ncbi:autotransporter domain-containing protein [Prosthecobacter sp.]|uniref:autotransporter domain-containing protein n=1 Tax=Prosthecobacter sp. TaxID=1965333 RepID=UPI003783CE7D
MLPARFFVLAAATLFVSTPALRAQETLISNYGQPNQQTNFGLSDQSQRVAWDFTTGADAYTDLFLTVQASNNDGIAHVLTAEFFTSASSAPAALVGTLSIPVTFTEGSFQDFSNGAAGAVTLAPNTSYWVVLSLGDPLNNPGPPGIEVRRIADGSTDAGGIYTSVGGTPLLSSTDNGATWVAENGSDAVKYLLQGSKTILIIPVVPPDAVLTAQSLQSLALQSTSVLLEDFAMRLFRARSGQGSGSDPNSVLIDLGGEDELVELGEGDGPGPPPRLAGLRTGGRAGQLRIFSSFDYGYAGISNSASGQRTNIYGGTLGMELRVTDHLSLGGGVGALSAQTRLRNGIASVDTDALTLAGYATYHRGGNYADLLYAATMLDHRVMRGAALSSPNSTVHTVQFNTGHNFTAGDFIHGPFVGVNYAHASTNPYAENGPGAVSVDRQRSDTILGRVGWQGSARFDRGWGVIIPQVRLSWDKQYLNETSAANVALVGVPGVVTRTGTGAVSQNGLGVGAGVMVNLNNRWSFAVNYQGHVLDKAANLHNVSAFVSYVW